MSLISKHLYQQTRYLSSIQLLRNILIVINRWLRLNSHRWALPNLYSFWTPNNTLPPDRILSSYNFPHRLKRGLGNNDAWTHYHKKDDNTNGIGVDEDETSDEKNDNQPQFKSFKPIGPSSTFDFDNQFKNLPTEKMKLSRRGVGRKRGKK